MRGSHSFGTNEGIFQPEFSVCYSLSIPIHIRPLPISHHCATTMTHTDDIPRNWPPLSATIVHYDGFAGMGIPHLAALRALGRLWNQGIHIGLQYTISYEIDFYASRALEAHLDAGQHQYAGGDVANFATDLHQQRIPPCVTLSLAEMVPCAVPQWKQILCHHMGKCHRVQPPHNSGEASRDRDFYVQPDLPDNFFSQAQLENCAPRIQRFADGSYWESKTPGQKPPTVKAIYPKLLRDQLDGTISDSDRRSLQTFQIRNKHHEPAWAGVMQFGTWLGLEPGLIERYRQQFPCSGRIDRKSGQPVEYIPPQTNPMNEACGQTRLCVNCENLTEVMGRAWHIGGAEQALLRLIHHGVQITKQANAPKHIALFTAGSPCNKISRGIWANMQHHTSRNKKVGPHASPSNAIWLWHEGLVVHSRLQQQLGCMQVGISFPFQNIHRCEESCPLADSLCDIVQFR